MDEDNFIDDNGVDPSYHYGSDNEHSPGRAPQVGIISCFYYAFMFHSIENMHLLLYFT